MLHQTINPSSKHKPLKQTHKLEKKKLEVSVL